MKIFLAKYEDDIFNLLNSKREGKRGGQTRPSSFKVKEQTCANF